MHTRLDSTSSAAFALCVAVALGCFGCEGLTGNDAGTVAPDGGSTSPGMDSGFDSGLAELDACAGADGGLCPACAAGAEDSPAACSDGCSNDGDAFVDCEDWDCDGIGSCPPGAVPCEDPASPENTPAACSDGCSNDGNRWADCDDLNCAGVGECEGTPDAGTPDAGTPDAGMPDACVPDCAGKDCGLDGCGGDCGTCASDEDCTSAGECVDPDACTYDSQCGYHEACEYGHCEYVECTSDSHCGSCNRCSDNVCRYCGMGPYGCYC